MKLFSWNVNGIRAVLKKEALQEFVNDFDPDILCLQETKAKRDQVEVDYPQYLEVWNSAERPGYSGTAVFSKTQPLSVLDTFPNQLLQINQPNLPEGSTIELINQGTLININSKWQDRYGCPLTEGRVQTVEYPEFFLVNTYVPNSKRDLSRLKLREELWDPTLLNYLKYLESIKPVITCGDFNAAHTALDLARPKANETSAGYTEEERRGIKNLLAAGFVDTFRFFNPSAQRYTWWSHWGNARVNNIGWRIDYFFISPQLVNNLKSAEIYEHIHGSDHCPISIELEF